MVLGCRHDYQVYNCSAQAFTRQWKAPTAKILFNRLTNMASVVNPDVLNIGDPVPGQTLQLEKGEHGPV